MKRFLVIGFVLLGCNDPSGRGRSNGGSNVTSLTAADACDAIDASMATCGANNDYGDCVSVLLSCSSAERRQIVKYYECVANRGCGDAGYAYCDEQFENVDLSCEPGDGDVFTCDSGETIDLADRCDAFVHCEDGTDEVGCGGGGGGGGTSTMQTRCTTFCNWYTGCTDMMSCTGLNASDCVTDCVANSDMDDVTWADFQNGGFGTCDQVNVTLCNHPDYMTSVQQACSCPTDNCPAGQFCYELDGPTQGCLVDTFWDLPTNTATCTTSCTAGYSCYESYCFRNCSIFY